MTPPSILEFARTIIRRHLEPGCLALDATVGNGHDTLFLAEVVGEKGLVVGLDVQDEALTRTADRIRSARRSGYVRLYREGHQHAARTIYPLLERPFRAAMYNLGYLPGSDKTVITRPETTLASVDQVIRLLSAGGAVTIVGYTGHMGGETEVGAVRDWSRRLPPDRFDVVHYEWMNRTGMPPELIAICKKS